MSELCADSYKSSSELPGPGQDRVFSLSVATGTCEDRVQKSRSGSMSIHSGNNLNTSCCFQENRTLLSILCFYFPFLMIPKLPTCTTYQRSLSEVRQCVIPVPPPPHMILLQPQYPATRKFYASHINIYLETSDIWSFLDTLHLGKHTIVGRMTGPPKTSQS